MNDQNPPVAEAREWMKAGFLSIGNDGSLRLVEDFSATRGELVVLARLHLDEVRGSDYIWAACRTTCSA